MPHRDRSQNDSAPREQASPTDTVRRIPLTGGAIALIGFDSKGVSRKTVIVEEVDATPEEAKALLKWVRKAYPHGPRLD